MKRLTTDDTESILFGLNLFFVKDNEVWIRGGGPDPDYQDCTLTDWINRAAAAQGIELDADGAESLGDIMYDCLQYGADATEGILALLHAAAVQAAEMRGRLEMMEDVLGDEYTLDGLREQAVAQIEPSRTAVGKPLTKEQLQERVGKWVWVEVNYNHDGALYQCDGWAFVPTPAFVAYLDQIISIDFYRKKFLAYDDPPVRKEE